MNAYLAASALIAACCSRDERSPTAAVDDLSPRRTLRCWRTAIVHAQDDIAGLGQRAVEEHAVATPAVHNRLVRRFAVNENNHRVLLHGVELGRLEHPTVECHSFTNAHGEELRRMREHRRQSGRQRRRVAHPPERSVRGEIDDVHRRRFVDARVGMERACGVRCGVVAVRPRLLLAASHARVHPSHRASTDRDIVGWRSRVRPENTASLPARPPQRDP